MPLDLAVIESRWWRNGNSSVRGLFDVLSDIHEDDPAAYHYEMFNNRSSLEEIVRRTARRYRNIYLAAHGSERSILGAEGRRSNNISRTKFRNILRQTAGLGRSRLRGLFVGSCNFINEENAQFLLENRRGQAVKIRWVAGYSREIDFIDSSVVDLYFWNAYYLSEKQSERAKIKDVAEQINSFMPGAHRNLAFNIFLRRGSEVKRLLPLADG